MGSNDETENPIYPNLRFRYFNEDIKKFVYLRSKEDLGQFFTKYCSLQNVLLDQWIYKFDSGGNEIFTNDIVRVDDEPDNIRVIFSNQIFNTPERFVLDVSGRHNIDIKYGTYRKIEGNMRLTIVGNIYQKPHLLYKDEKRKVIFKQGKICYEQLHNHKNY